MPMKIARRKRAEQILTIAKARMNASAGEPILDRLETRNADHLDVFEIAVWDLKAMLESAYDAGCDIADQDCCDDTGMIDVENRHAVFEAMKAHLSPEAVATIADAINRCHTSSPDVQQELMGLVRNLIYNLGGDQRRKALTTLTRAGDSALVRD